MFQPFVPISLVRGGQWYYLPHGAAGTEWNGDCKVIQILSAYGRYSLTASATWLKLINLWLSLECVLSYPSQEPESHLRTLSAPSNTLPPKSTRMSTPSNGALTHAFPIPLLRYAHRESSGTGLTHASSPSPVLRLLKCSWAAECLQEQIMWKWSSRKPVDAGMGYRRLS